MKTAKVVISLILLLTITACSVRQEPSSSTPTTVAAFEPCRTGSLSDQFVCRAHEEAGSTVPDTDLLTWATLACIDLTSLRQGRPAQSNWVTDWGTPLALKGYELGDADRMLSALEQTMCPA